MQEYGERVDSFRAAPERTFRPSDKKVGFLDGKAFEIIEDHITVYLEVDFARCLADHVLRGQPENTALAAFAHKLRNMLPD